MPDPTMADDPRLATVYAAIEQLDTIIQPTNINPLGPTPESLDYDWEAIARSGFTDVKIARHVRNLLVAAQHAISRDVDSAAIAASVAFDASALAAVLRLNLPEVEQKEAA